MNDRRDDEGPSGTPEWERLARYIAGESDAAEARRVRQWLAEEPARSELLGALERSIGTLAGPPHHDIDVEAALRRVHQRIEARPGASPALERRRTAWTPWRSPALRVAAALALLLGATLVWRSANEPPSPRAVEYATTVGETRSVVLPEGSRVLLAPDSRLVVEDGYGEATDRTVRLYGEALFGVVHDDARPFRVRADGAVIVDLGTAFLVRTGAPGTTGLRVVVTEGSVRLEAAPDAQPVVLRAGDRAVVDSAGRLRAERGIDTEAELAWTEGRLVFEEARLDRVAAELRRWYGIELQVDPALAERRLTASFEDEGREEVREVVALALGAGMEWRGDTVVVSPRP